MPYMPNSHITLVMFVMKPLAQCVILFSLVASAVDSAKHSGPQILSMACRPNGEAHVLLALLNKSMRN